MLDPLAAPVDDTYIWAKPDAQRLENAGDLTRDPVTNARTTLNTAHPRPWGWKVVTYLWTKGVGAGALALALLAHLMGIEMGVIGDYVAPLLGLFGAATTGALLVWDLKRPERFLYIFLKSNFTSWLVLGAYVLTVFSGGCGPVVARGGPRPRVDDDCSGLARDTGQRHDGGLHGLPLRTGRGA